MRVFEEKQLFTQWWMQLLNLGLLVLLCYFLYQWYIVGKSVDKVDANNYFGQALVIILLLLSMCIPYIFSLRTILNKTGIGYRFYPFHRRIRKIDWSDLEKVYVRKYKPLSEYGGWGYRVGLSGNAYNVKGNQGIQLKFKNGKKLLLGTQRPEEAQLIIDRYFKNEGI